MFIFVLKLTIIMNTSINKFSKILILCIGILFFFKNGQAQCSGFNITATQTGDGPYLGDATVQASISNGSGLYNYIYWKNSAGVWICNGINASSLSAGSYWVQAQDSITLCVDSFYITIIDTGAYNCNGFNLYSYNFDSCQLNDAGISTYTVGGSGNYSYMWSNGATTSYIANNLIHNTAYTVTIVDNITGCTKTLTDTAIDDTCNICNNFSASIGKSDLAGLNDILLYAFKNNCSYLWSSGETSSAITNRTTGSYWVRVQDSTTGCVDTAYITVLDSTWNPCNNNYTYIYDSDSCYYLGKLNVSHYGGSGLYSTLWNTGDTMAQISNKAPGTYSVITTDRFYGCKDTAYFVLNSDTCDVCQFFSTSISKYVGSGYNKISLYAYHNNGNNCSYLWSNGETNSSIHNKPSGFYWVRVQDLTTGCVDTAYITVIDSSINPCNNFSTYIYKYDDYLPNDMSLSSSIYNGSGLYSFKWYKNGVYIDSNSGLYGVSTGTYTLIVMDKINGCKDTTIQYFLDSTWTPITGSPCDYFQAYINSYDSCLNNDLTLYAMPYGTNIGNCTYLWNTGSTANTLYNKPTGNYWVIITDTVNGCIDTLSYYAVDTNFKCCQTYFYAQDAYVGATKNLYGYQMNGLTTTYTWDFGDNTTGSGITPVHTYNTYGNFTACLYSQDANGCKDTFCNVMTNPLPAKNLYITHFGIPYIVDTSRLIYINYQNIGNTVENATIEYSFPAGMTYVSSTIAPTTAVGNVLTFNVGSLCQGCGGTIQLYMETPNSFTLGTIKCDTAKILTLANDVDVSNNVSYDCDSVVSSWDPNEKMVNPSGVGEIGAIDPKTKELNYLINFQNEGNWRTYRVRVEDEIDPSLDISSLRIGDASHPYRLVKTGTKLTWYFDNIELTPKSQDEAKSKGYVQYTLKLNSNVAIGTQIKNTAYIYFDANPAIITNTTKNTLKNSDATNSIGRTAQESIDFTISKSNEAILLSSEEKMKSIKIYDLNGRMIVERNPNALKAEISNPSLIHSIYIVVVEIGESSVMKKFEY